MSNNEEWQLCPKCNGQGIVSKPPYVPGDVHQWSSTSTSFTCDVCNGAKTISRPSIFRYNALLTEAKRLRDAIATQATNGARTRNDLVERFDKFLKTVK